MIAAPVMRHLRIGLVLGTLQRGLGLCAVRCRGRHPVLELCDMPVQGFAWDRQIASFRAAAARGTGLESDVCPAGSVITPRPVLVPPSIDLRHGSSFRPLCRRPVGSPGSFHPARLSGCSPRPGRSQLQVRNRQVGIRGEKLINNRQNCGDQRAKLQAAAWPGDGRPLLRARLGTRVGPRIRPEGRSSVLTCVFSVRGC